MPQFSLHLAFYQNQLFKTCFKWDTDPSNTLYSVRGKTTGAYLATGSFQWTRATQAMSTLLLKYRIREEFLNEEPVLAGYKGSLASSLEYALSKKPLWLLEMFGSTKSGIPRLKHLFLTSNPSRNAGPVLVAVNPKVLSAGDIFVSHNQKESVSRKELKDIYLSILTRYERTGEPTTKHMVPIAA